MNKKIWLLLFAAIIISCAPLNQNQETNVARSQSTHSDCVNKGIVDACTAAARAYQHGIGGPKNPDRAIFYLNHAKFLSPNLVELPVDQEVEQAKAEQAQVDEQTRTEQFDKFESALTALETELDTLTPPWTEEKIARFVSAIELFNTLSEHKLASEYKKRIDDAQVHLERYRPSVKKAHEKMAREQERKEVAKKKKAERRFKANSKRAVSLGWKAVLKYLKAPSTAKLVEALPIRATPNGLILVAYTVDAQNGFGAMLRDTFAVVVNLDQNVALCAPKGSDLELTWVMCAKKDRCDFVQDYVRIAYGM